MILSNKRQVLAAVLFATVAFVDIQPTRCLEFDGKRSASPKDDQYKDDESRQLQNYQNGEQEQKQHDSSQSAHSVDQVNEKDSSNLSERARLADIPNGRTDIYRQSGFSPGSTPGGEPLIPTPFSGNPQSNPNNVITRPAPGPGASLNPDNPTPSPIRQQVPGFQVSIPRPVPATSSNGGALRTPTDAPTDQRIPRETRGPYTAFTVDASRPLSYLVDRSDSPTNEPSPSPSDSPTPEPSPRPTRFPTPKPSKRPTTAPTKKPTKTPTKQPTPEPTGTPSISPKPTTRSPTTRPSEYPTKKPTAAPTASPSDSPTGLLNRVNRPSFVNSPVNSPVPTERRTEIPTQRRTATPTKRCTDNPTKTPTEGPSDINEVSGSPVATERPTERCTETPTKSPTERPIDVIEVTASPVETETSTESTEEYNGTPTFLPTTWMPTTTYHPTVNYSWLSNIDKQGRFDRLEGTFFNQEDPDQPILSNSQNNVYRPGVATFNNDDPTPSPVRSYQNVQNGGSTFSDAFQREFGAQASSGGALRQPTNAPTDQRIPRETRGPYTAFTVDASRPLSYLVDRSDSPTSEPSPSPSDSPTPEPTPHPTRFPTPKPSKRPTTAPPTKTPTKRPTPEPTGTPSISPKPTTRSPTARPSEYPTKKPTAAPTASPSDSPTGLLNLLRRPSLFSPPPTDAPATDAPSVLEDLDFEFSIENNVTETAGADDADTGEMETVVADATFDEEESSPTWFPTTWAPTSTFRPTRGFRGRGDSDNEPE